MQSLEVILSNNIQVKYVKKTHNMLADYLSLLGGPGNKAPFLEQFLKVHLPGTVNIMAEGGLVDPLLLELSEEI